MGRIMVNGVEYEQVKREVVDYAGGGSLASCMVGKNVIVRSRNEGINCGTVVLADETGVVLKNARRLWRHKPLNKKLSWYEGVAESGLHEDSIVSGTVKQKVIIEEYSMTLCTEEAYDSIMNFVPNES